MQSYGQTKKPLGTRPEGLQRQDNALKSDDASTRAMIQGDSWEVKCPPAYGTGGPAEMVGFEPTDTVEASSAFQALPFGRSGTSPIENDTLRLRMSQWTKWGT